MNIKFALVILAVLAVVIGMSTYTVGEREKVLLFSLGEIKAADLQPGLHFKFPLINNVRKYDSRVLTLETQPENFITAEKKNVTVDFFVKWRIADTAEYYRSVGGETGVAQAALLQIVKGRLREAFGKRTIQEAISGEREIIMEIVRSDIGDRAAELGIEIVDLRIIQIELPPEVSESVFGRMRAEREQAARQFRARGKEAAQRIRAAADREVAVILAEAYREAQQIRGEGDAEATQIYARAYGRNPEFYSFYRSLEAYTNAFNSEDDILVLEPDSQFFRYFAQPRLGEIGADPPQAGGRSDDRRQDEEGRIGRVAD